MAQCCESSENQPQKYHEDIARVHIDRKWRQRAAQRWNEARKWNLIESQSAQCTSFELAQVHVYFTTKGGEDWP